MKFYFVSTGRRAAVEIEVIKRLKPKRILGSYHYFKNIVLSEFFEEIGYEPEFILDSGAFSAWKSGKKIDQDKYIAYIKANEENIYRYIALDKLGDTEKSYDAYIEMKNKGMSPIPVFHYMGDEEYLRKYIAQGETLIALGGTVPIKSKKTVAEWVKMLSWLYPEVRFHLLGSASRKILDHCDIESSDASTWMMKAIMGEPRHIPGNDKQSRFERATWNMKQMIELWG